MNVRILCFLLKNNSLSPDRKAAYRDLNWQRVFDLTPGLDDKGEMGAGNILGIGKVNGPLRAIFQDRGQKN